MAVTFVEVPSDRQDEPGQIYDRLIACMSCLNFRLGAKCGMPRHINLVLMQLEAQV